MKALANIKKSLKQNTETPFVVPSGIGKQKVLVQIETLFSTAIMADIRQAVENESERIENTTKVIKQLGGLHEIIMALPPSVSQEKLKQKMRYLILVIENRISRFDAAVVSDSGDAGSAAYADHMAADFDVIDGSVTTTNVDLLVSKLAEIKAQIGSVPRLNPSAPLPKDEFLPKKFSKSIKEWQNRIWENPGRSGEERLEFMTKQVDGHAISSVRLHLIDEDKDDKDKTIETALSYADGDFYRLGDLQADHLQPSESIVARQLELIEAMNIDPLFAAEIQAVPQSKGYFIQRAEDGKIWGTKYFFMLYHSCIGNLWFISTAMNTGMGKGNQDPVAWLSAQPNFGVRFFTEACGEVGVDKSCILYRAPNGQLLAEAAKVWFRETYAEDIVAAHFVLHDIKEPMRTHAAEVSASGSKKEKVKLMAGMVLAGQLVGSGRKRTADEAGLDERSSDQTAGSSSSPHRVSEGSTSIPTDDAELTAENLVKIKKQAQKKRIALPLTNLVDSLSSAHVESAMRIKRAKHT